MELIRETNRKLDKNGHNIKYGIFKCTCGKEEEKILTNGKRQKQCMECGNKKIGEKAKIRNTKHGGRYTRLYRIWKGMKERCLKPYAKNYDNYGGRGISICEQWLDFKEFRNWANNNGYTDELTIDRKDNDGSYEPTNCRFVTYKEQNRNKRNNVMNEELSEEIRIYNQNHTLKETEIKFNNVSKSILSNIIYGGQWL